MKKSRLAVVGTALLIGGLGYLGIYQFESVKVAALDQQAKPQILLPLPEKVQQADQAGASACTVVTPPQLSRRVIAEQDTVALLVRIRPQEGCSVSLEAPSFALTPDTKEYRFEANDTRLNQDTDLVWTLSPEKSGTFDIPVTVAGQTSELHLKVTNALGFSPAQAQIVAGLSSFLGPALTLPWWLELIEQRRKARQEAERSSRTNPAT